MPRLTPIAAVSLSLLCAHLSAADPAEPPTSRYAEPVKLCDLQNKDVNESSGLAASRLAPGRYWTHNDSGDKARLFCFDLQGRHLGTCKLKRIKSIDWEDMCSFVLDDRPRLVVADTGDNLGRRRVYLLHIFDEPKNPSKDVKDVRTVKLNYPTGAVDCEAVGFDPVLREFIFVEKRFALSCRVFRAGYPKPDADRIQAELLGRIRIPVVTAMDISPDGARAMVMTIGQAFEFTRGPDESWAEAFRAKPTKVTMPPRRQGEAICYDSDGRDLLLTSEQTPAPLFKVPAKGN